MKQIQVEAGDRFNGWTVVKEFGRKRGHRTFLCRCSCGTVGRVFLQALRRNQSKSCGCFRRKTATKHGMYRTPEYGIWAQIKYRCSPRRTAQISWKNYGGRGIRVCEEWRNSFESFLAYVGPRPSPCHSIDRINNDGDYEPGNIRWATAKEQRSNKRATIWERIVISIGVRAGLSAEWIRERVAAGMSDSELSRHIAAYYKPEAQERVA